MEKIQEKLDNLDTIINNIKYNDFLRKINQGKSIKNISELDKTNKENLNNRLETIEKFNHILKNIIKSNPNPDTLDNKLVEYIGYEQYYSEKIIK